MRACQRMLRRRRRVRRGHHGLVDTTLVAAQVRQGGGRTPTQRMGWICTPRLVATTADRRRATARRDLKGRPRTRRRDRIPMPHRRPIMAPRIPTTATQGRRRHIMGARRQGTTGDHRRSRILGLHHQATADRPPPDTGPRMVGRAGRGGAMRRALGAVGRLQAMRGLGPPWADSGCTRCWKRSSATPEPTSRTSTMTRARRSSASPPRCVTRWCVNTSRRCWADQGRVSGVGV